jgi:hypothetical protein
MPSDHGGRACDAHIAEYSQARPPCPSSPRPAAIRVPMSRASPRAGRELSAQYDNSPAQGTRDERWRLRTNSQRPLAPPCLTRVKSQPPCSAPDEAEPGPVTRELARCAPRHRGGRSWPAELQGQRQESACGHLAPLAPGDRPSGAPYQGRAEQPGRAAHTRSAGPYPAHAPGPSRTVRAGVPPHSLPRQPAPQVSPAGTSQPGELPRRDVTCSAPPSARSQRASASWPRSRAPGAARPGHSAGAGRPRPRPAARPRRVPAEDERCAVHY